MKPLRRAIAAIRPIQFFAAIAIASLVCLSACDVDSYLDPSRVERIENTPIILPILDRLDVIEEPDEGIPGLSEIRSEDLIPEITEYSLGPGDLVTITVFELLAPNVESVQTRRIDELGFVRMPVIGQIKASGLTTKQLEQRIIDILDPDIIRDPMVSVIVQEGRQRTFNVIGAGGGTFTLLKSDFRLLDALSLSQAFPFGQKEIYVIRQVPLSDLVERGYLAEDVAPGTHADPLRPTEGDDDDQTTDPGKLIDELMRGLDEPEEPEEDTGAEAEDMTGPLAEALEPEEAAQKRWVNIGGKWVEVAVDDEAAVPGIQGALDDQGPARLEGELPPADQLITQRVIEVDAQKLMEGDATQNIVIRPGDIIRVPVPRTGNIYVGGAVARPGTYSLPGEKTLTLKQLFISAGGLSPIGIPERVDLIRRLDDDTEAIVRLNYRAIGEGVTPDFYLKPDDTINVGTNPLATFLAITRNSFRLTYGFGFLLDRNFNSQVWGELENN